MCDKKNGIQLSKGAKKAFSFILHNRSTTRASLCNALDIGAVTAGKYTQELLASGMIQEDGFSESSGGRKPIVYSVSNSGHFILCINISTIYCEVAVADFSLQLRTVRHFSIHHDDNPDVVVGKIWAVYTSIKEEQALTDSSFIGAGLILFSSIKNEHGVMYKPILQYMNKGWIDYPIIDKLSNLLPMPIFTEKGITATASLEYNFGLGRKCHSLLYILCAMNIRSAFVLNGRVQGNSPFFEDAFGHMVVDFDGPKCGCGQYGCLNCYASINAIMDEYRNNVKIGMETVIKKSLDEVMIEDICKASTLDDACAIISIKKAASILGIALANYVNITSPEIVLVSGLLPELSDLYYETAVTSAKERLKRTANCNAEFFRVGKFKYPLTTSGASLVLDRYFST